MFDIRSEHVYIELVKIWNKYPNIKTEYLKERDKKGKSISLFIQDRFSKCFDEMIQIYERYYGENCNVTNVEKREFYSRYFGTFRSIGPEESD